LKLLRKFRRSGAWLPQEETTRDKVHGFVSVARSHEGSLRELNEDRFIDLSDIGLWAVADGMGGHQAGDMAAQMTVDALGALVENDFAPAPSAIHDAIEAVNTRLLARVSKGGLSATSGSTLVALIADKGRYTCLWAGDSRAYLLRDGQLNPISHDHSLVQEMVDAGLLSAQEARSHPRANVITRAVGVVDDLRLEAVTGNLEVGDRLLLCSDGLTATLEEEEIVMLLAKPDLAVAADALLAAALAGRARDNVTFVLIDPTS
jgi:serine/threonine protein phosphatase PrpC